MPSSVESQIDSLVAAFVSDLTALVRASAVTIVEEALAGQHLPQRRRGAPKRGAASAPSRRTKGAKRDPNAIAALTEQLAAFIKKTPGQRIEQIGKALGMPTRDLTLSVKKLVAAKRVSTKGQKRATTYFAR
jgi:hypothetical protein